MYRFKKEYLGKVFFVLGFGKIDTKKIKADTIKKYSELKEYNNLNRYIEEATVKKPKKAKEPKNDSE